MTKRIWALLLFVAFLPLPLCAQQIGASITGHILDPAGAAVSGASIKLTSTTTAAVYMAQSDAAGIYQLPFVLVGSYILTVEQQGFKKYEQQGIELAVAQKAVIDINLQLGAVTQTVSVTADAPVLQQESGDRGWDIGPAAMASQAFITQTPLSATWFAPGVTEANSEESLSQWGSGGATSLTINGGQSGVPGFGSTIPGQTVQFSGNQVLVDGVAATGSTGGQVFYSPPSSTVDQITVQDTMFDAEYGWSTGGSIDQITKHGTNQWHGHGYDYITNTWLQPNSWANIQSGVSRSPTHINQFGGEVGGPVPMRGPLHGKGKMFVYYDHYQYWQVQRDSVLGAVPTAAEREGNFNGVCSSVSDGVCGPQIQLYDPSTTATTTSNTDPTSCYYNQGGVSTGANPCRSQNGPLVSGNVVEQINPIAAKVLSIIPLPYATGVTATCPTGVTSGQTGGVAGLCGTFQGNQFTNPSSRKFIDYFPVNSGRLDWDFNDKTQAFFEYTENALAETRSYFYSTVGGINPAETSVNNPLYRTTERYVLQLTHTFNPSTVLTLRTGLNRYPNGSGDSDGVAYDPAALGFGSTYESEAYKQFPEFNVSSMGNSGGAMAGGVPVNYTASDTLTHEAVISHTTGKHNLRFGWQRYDLGDYVESPGCINGCFTYSGYFTEANPFGAVGLTGYGLADFELGYPISGYINEPALPEYWMHQESAFVQDDWHLRRNLTVNMGLRWDYQGPMHDKYNRLLDGFCTTCTSPLGFIPELGTVQGGPTYAGDGGSPSGIFNRKFDNFGPRVGFAYNFAHDTVLRGGWGVIYASEMLEPGAAPGFSQETSLTAVPGAAGVFNPNISQANPFPNGLLPIAGDGYGLAGGLGTALSFPDPNMDIPRTQQYSLEVQRSFGQNWLISLAYVGSKTSRLVINRNIDFVPLSDLPYTPQFTINPGGYTESQLSAAVANPFLGYIPSPYSSITAGTFLTGTSVPRSQLLLPFPQFSSVTELYDSIGRSHYNSLQFDVQKRLSMGLVFDANFTWSKALQALGFLNPQDSVPQQSYTVFDLPRSAHISMTYFAPFGPGKRWLSHTNPVLSHMVDGWSLNAVSRIQDGFPVPMPSGVMPTGASTRTSNPTLQHYFNTCWTDLSGVNHDCTIDSTPAWKQEVPGQLYEWSPIMSGVRYVGLKHVDASAIKVWSVKERLKFTYRCDVSNLFNTPEWYGDLDIGFTDPSFGFVGYPANQPSQLRTIVMSLQLTF